MNPHRHTLLVSLVALATLASTTAHAQTAQGSELAAPAPAPVPQPAPAAPPYAAPPYGQAPYGQPYYAQPYQPGYGYGYAPPPRGRLRPIVGYREETRNPPAIWGTGLGIFLAGYLLDCAILTPLANAISEDRSGASEQDAWAWSLLPIAGPMIQLGIGAPHPAIPIVTGLLQVGGLVTFIVGLSTQETRRVPIYQGDPEDPNMLRVELDGGPIEGGAQVTLSVHHL